MTGTLVWDGSSSARLPISIVAEPSNGDLSLGFPTAILEDVVPVKFELNGLQSGSYSLRVVGPPGTRLKSVTWKGRDMTNRPFDLLNESEIADVVITLTNKAATLRGTVRDPEGIAKEGSTVLIFPTDASTWTGYGLRPSHIITTRVASDHTFIASLLPAGEHFIVAIPSNVAESWRDVRFLQAAAVVASRVNLKWGDVHHLDLQARSVRTSK
jgi:hypothetical protein